MLMRMRGCTPPPCKLPPLAIPPPPGRPSLGDRLRPPHPGDRRALTREFARGGGGYHESKTEVDWDSLLQATLLPGPVEDEVDTYAALGLAGRVSELQLNKKEDMCVAFRILHDVLYKGKVACICLQLG